MITIIPISQLEPHPDNPRKDLGDLTELAASIKKQGLLQNLTVVPSPVNTDKYRIVIGHRRHAAATLAGLTELPCSIDTKMTYPEQLAVMMSENVQRNDLTVVEKVGGIQMMLDLGMDVREISSNTGISDTTVRRYAKLSTLDRGKMQRAEQNGATLLQFGEVAEIEFDDLREEALQAIGTNNYSSVLYKVRAARAKRDVGPLLLAKLNEYAKQIEKAGPNHSWQWNLWFTEKDAMDHVVEYSKKKGDQYEYVLSDNGITLYKVMQPESDEKAAEKRRGQERVKKLVTGEEAMARTAAELRREWLLNTNFRYQESNACEFALWAMTRTKYTYAPTFGGTLAAMMNDPKSTSTAALVIDADDLKAFDSAGTMIKAMVLAAYDRVNSSGCRLMDRYTGKYVPDPMVEELYKYLCRLGYVPSDDEEDWLDGTHACYTLEDDT